MNAVNLAKVLISGVAGFPSGDRASATTTLSTTTTTTLSFEIGIGFYNEIIRFWNEDWIPTVNESVNAYNEGDHSTARIAPEQSHDALV